MLKQSYSSRGRHSNADGESGFTAVEFVVCVALIAILTAILLPRFTSLVSAARQAQTRQDALAIGAAVELLRTEKAYDPDDADIARRVRERGGLDFDGELSELSADGSFLYTKRVGNAVYAARYSSATGGVTDGTD